MRWLALVLLAGCSPTIPEGWYSCDYDRDCPAGWRCATSAGRCYQRCDPQVCGDVNRSGGAPDTMDVARLRLVLDGAITLDTCDVEAADVIRDGVLTEADYNALDWLVREMAGTTPPTGCNGVLGCVPCEPARCSVDASEGCCAPGDWCCGDWNRDGVINNSDGSTSEQCACAFWAGDVNHDGAANEVDVVEILGWMSSGGPSPLNCAPVAPR